MRYDQKRLLFRRQFILGPRFLTGFPAWKRLDVGPSIRLTVHPDLPTCRAVEGTASVTLLGYILDPYRLHDHDADILQRLLRHLEDGGSRQSLIGLTYPLGGRWILIVKNQQAEWLFNDPCGFRQVFFARPPSKGLWCASQPELLAETLDLAPNPEAVAFIRASGRRNPQYWWPGDSSLYGEVRHLQPNHYLDLKTGTDHRFWPHGDLTPRPAMDVVAENGRLLRGLIESASRRFELALGVTAGKDTRALLAASRPIRHQLYPFTLLYWNLTRDSPDVRIPNRLLTRLGLPHHLIVCPSRVDKKFRKLCARNMTTAHDCYASIARGLFDGYPPSRACLMGTAIGTTVGAYRRRLRRGRPQTDPESVDAETLAWLTDQEHPFAVEALRRWRSGLNQTNVPVLDLFYWEGREGNWQAMAQSERDVAQEMFSPFSCRLFLANALAVPESYRAGPSYAFIRSIILDLWPEVLSESINPPAEPAVLSSSINAIGQLRDKIVGRRRQIPSPLVQRVFQRHPSLTDLVRLRG